MKKLALVAVSALLLSGGAFAKTCEEKAIDKNGNPLHGAAKTAFLKKCNAEAGTDDKGSGGKSGQGGCAERAIDKNGKPLHGAAKDAFMKKCMSEAK